MNNQLTPEDKIRFRILELEHEVMLLKAHLPNAMATEIKRVKHAIEDFEKTIELNKLMLGRFTPTKTKVLH
jgi:hypothetical protein